MRKAEAGDAIQMISCGVSNGERITGMMAHRKLIEPLLHRLADDEKSLRARLVAQNVECVAAQPGRDNQNAADMAADMMRGACPPPPCHGVRLRG